MSTFSRQILRDLLASTDLDHIDKTYMTEIIGQSLDDKRENNLARLILRSVVSYYETHRNLTKIESRVINSLIGSLESVAEVKNTRETETPIENRSVCGRRAVSTADVPRAVENSDVRNNSIAHGTPSFGNTTSTRMSPHPGMLGLQDGITHCPSQPGEKEGSKIVASNLPMGMTQAQIEKYFADWAGPIKHIELTYRSESPCRGVATIMFVHSDSGSKAVAALHGIRFDNLPITVQVVADAASRAREDTAGNNTASVHASDLLKEGRLPSKFPPIKDTYIDGDTSMQNAMDVPQITNTTPTLSQTFATLPTNKGSVNRPVYTVPSGYSSACDMSTDEYIKTYPIASRLMFKSGWTPGNGLGPQGHGIKEPIVDANELTKIANKGNDGIGLKPFVDGGGGGGSREESETNMRARSWQNLARDPKTHDNITREANRRPRPEEHLVLCSIQELPIAKNKLHSKPSKAHGALQAGEEENKFLKDPYLFNEGRGHPGSKHNGF